MQLKWPDGVVNMKLGRVAREGLGAIAQSALPANGPTHGHIGERHSAVSQFRPAGSR